MAEQDVEVQVDRLVLEGFAPRQAHRVARDVEGELTRLLTDRGLPSGVASMDGAERLVGGTLQRPDRPGSAGAGIAGAVFDGLARPRVARGQMR